MGLLYLYLLDKYNKTISQFRLVIYSAVFIIFNFVATSRTIVLRGKNSLHHKSARNITSIAGIIEQILMKVFYNIAPLQTSISWHLLFPYYQESAVY